MAITQECCVQSSTSLWQRWRQHPTRHQLYGHLPPITKTIQVRRTRHAGHCWRSRDELIRDVLLWIPTHGRAKAGRPARTYIQQLCEDTGCCPEDLPRAMNDREEWRKRVRDIRAASTIWWWWWFQLLLYLFIWTWNHKIGQSSHKMYSNNLVNFRRSRTILNACTNKIWKPIEGTTYIEQIQEATSHKTESVWSPTSHLKPIQKRRTKHAGHSWRSKNEFISNFLLWTPSKWCASVGRPTRTYLQQLCTDTGCSLEDLQESIDNRDEWRQDNNDDDSTINFVVFAFLLNVIF